MFLPYVLLHVLINIAILGVVFATEMVKRQGPFGVMYHCTTQNTAALTFDDGPYLYVTDISDLLTNSSAKGTFFYNGFNWACIYDQVSIQRVLYAYNQGHQIASHTWSHPHLTTLSHDQINNEMQEIEQAIVDITGAYPALTRPPYGEINDLVIKVAQERGQQLVLWDLNSGDSTGASRVEQMQNYDNVIAQHPSSILTLNHETHETTAHQLLPYAIQRLQAAGYRLVTVAECLGIQPYKSVGAAGTPNSTWHC